ncbi:MAG TPA: ABC transporter substrate-binding protein [Acetobacteraceae bacterium]|nr:ABC transporter substrate-binding protein [Acetobacteraceae bacterium]
MRSDPTRRIRWREAGVALAICAFSVWIAAPAWSAGAAPKRGGDVVMTLDATGMAVLNTDITSLSPALYMADVWADGLMARDGQGNRTPHLATRWAISPDGKTYTFFLRHGVKWSDGQPFTSKDVAFTLTQFGKLNTYLSKLMPLVAKVETPDDYTVVVTLTQPVTAALDLFDKENFPLMPEHVYAGTDIATNAANRKPVGLGPFKLQSWEPGRSLTFVRNPYYWDQPKPYLDHVLVALTPSAQQQLNAVIRGEADWMQFDDFSQVQQAQQAAKNGEFKVVKITMNAPERSSIDFNLRRSPMSDVRVRRALFEATDRQRINADAYRGLAFPAVSAIPEQFTALYDPSVNYNKMYPYDPVAAGKLLDEAGFPLKNGKRFSVELTYQSGPPFDAIAHSIAAQWQKIGVDVHLAGLDAQIWLDKVYRRHDFDLSLASLTGRSDPTLGVDRSFVCNPTRLPYTNPTGYSNPALDRIAVAAAAAPEDQRRALYKQYEEIVARDLNEITLTNAPTYNAVSTRFSNLDRQFDISFNEHPNWAEVWLGTGH